MKDLRLLSEESISHYSSFFCFVRNGIQTASVDDRFPLIPISNYYYFSFSYIPHKLMPDVTAATRTTSATAHTNHVNVKSQSNKTSSSPLSTEEGSSSSNSFCYRFRLCTNTRTLEWLQAAVAYFIYIAIVSSSLFSTPPELRNPNCNYFLFKFLLKGSNKKKGSFYGESSI